MKVHRMTLAYEVICIFFKGAQILIFMFLWAFLCRQIKNFGEHSFGVLICAINISNGICSILRVTIVQPKELALDEDAEFFTFVICYSLEISFFVIGQWLYAFKSYFNAREIFLMFNRDSGGATATRNRKLIYQVISSTNSFFILLVCLVLAGCYILGIHKLELIAIICMSYVFLQLPIIAVMLAVALCRFRSIVKSQESLILNTK